MKKKLDKALAAIRSVIRSSRGTHDALALVQLRPLLSGYLPMSSMAMSPAEIARICNDVIINGRKSIVEFGSGASTVYIAKVMSADSVIYTVDHDSEWLEIVGRWLEAEGVRDRVVMVHAPLKEIAIGGHIAPWYDLSVLTSSLPHHSIDCVIVDGPPAGASGCVSKIRYPAIPVIKNRMAEECSVYLDDVVRRGEYEIALSWEKELNAKFEFRLNCGGYAVARRGEGYVD